MTDVIPYIAAFGSGLVFGVFVMCMVCMAKKGE